MKRYAPSTICYAEWLVCSAQCGAPVAQWVFYRTSLHIPCIRCDPLKFARPRPDRLRNPDYDRNYKAKMRAVLKAARVRREAVEGLHAKMFAQMPLALPAPAVVIEIPGMNMIPTSLEKSDAILTAIRVRD